MNILRRHLFPAALLLLVSVLGGSRPVLAVSAGPHGESGSPRGAHRPEVVVTTTMLGTAVSELAGDWCMVKVLMPPQGCPGEFDLAPGMLKDLRRAGLILRHDYQGFLEQRFRGREISSAKRGVVASGGAETLPENYLALCRQVANLLGQTFPDRAGTIAAQMGALERRVRAAGGREQARAAAVLKGAPLLAASYQSEFVNWAGGKAIVTFDQGEDLSLRQLQEIIEKAQAARVAGVVGNLQWGDHELHALSEALGVPGVLLSNYPAGAEAGAWDRLLKDNVDALLSLLGHE